MDVSFKGIKDNRADGGKKTEFELIPDGTAVEAKVVNMKDAKTKTDKHYFDTEFLIVSGEYENRHVWGKLYTDDGINWKLGDLMKNTGMWNPNSGENQKVDTSKLINKQVLIVVEVSTYGAKPKNEVKFINRSKENPPGAEAETASTGGFKLG